MKSSVRPHVPVVVAFVILVAGATSAAAQSQTPVTDFATVFGGGAVIAAPVLYLVVRTLRRRRDAQLAPGVEPDMVRPSEQLRAHRDEVARIIERNGGTNPRVFGSVARGEDSPGSDLDLLVTVPPEAAWTFASTARELSELLGVHVDVVSEGGLKEKHRQSLDEAVPL